MALTCTQRVRPTQAIQGNCYRVPNRSNNNRSKIWYDRLNWTKNKMEQFKWDQRRLIQEAGLSTSRTPRSWSSSMDRRGKMLIREQLHWCRASLVDAPALEVLDRMSAMPRSTWRAIKAHSSRLWCQSQHPKCNCKKVERSCMHQSHLSQKAN